jgi:hypothetical protein
MTAPLHPTGWYPARSGAPDRPLAEPVAALQPEDDPFYSYTGSTPLASIAPGTVLTFAAFSTTYWASRRR